MKKILYILFLLFGSNSFAADTTIIITGHVDTIIFSTPAIIQPIGNRINIVIIAGQSNGEGGDQDTTHTPALMKGVFDSALIFYKPTNTTALDGSIQKLQYGVNNNFTTPALRFGPETGIAYYVTQAGKKIGIIKYCWRGSRLADTGTTINGCWQIDAHTSQLKHYPILLTFVTQGLTAFKAAGYDPHVIAFSWIQGESDAGYLAAANAYYIQCTRLFDKFRSDIRPYDPLIDSIHFLITKIRLHQGSYYTTVRTAENNMIANYPNTHAVIGDSWARISDSLHYTRDAQANGQGKAIADILIPLIK